MADLREMMTRQAGPLPVWAWTGMSAAVIAGFMFFRKSQGTPEQSSGSGVGPGGTAGDFKSSTSTTKTDAEGNTYVTQYESSGQSPFGIPGFLTNQASPMPYSWGDIYNNISTNVPLTVPGTTINLPPWNHPLEPIPPPPPQVVTPPAPPPPPPPAPAPPSDRPAHTTWTVAPGDNLYNIAKFILRERWNREPNPSEITWYWQWMYDMNRNIIGPNPGLIHPGQTLILPEK